MSDYLDPYGLWGSSEAVFIDRDNGYELVRYGPRDKDYGDLTPFVGPQLPQPTVVAYRNYRGPMAEVSYYLEDGRWLNCQSGELWKGVK